MNLGRTQQLFMRLLPRLIDKAHDLGFEIRGGDLFRDPRVHGEYGEKVGYSSALSNHKMKIAIDLNLFKDREFMSKTTDHAELGAWWISQHDLCRWGGTDGKDGNHYSLLYDGRW